MSRRDAPATHRNRDPILEVLTRWLVEPARVLEIASGTGQHAIYFATKLPHLSWQPSDHDPAALESIESWVADEGAGNIAAPVKIDASDLGWPSGIDAEPIDAIFNANMIHIAPWPVAVGLFAGAERVLRTGGLLFLYGPFRIGGGDTSPSNAAFDEDLRLRNPDWGVRDLESVESLAHDSSFDRIEVNELPANNKLIVFRKRAGKIDEEPVR